MHMRSRIIRTVAAAAFVIPCAAQAQLLEDGDMERLEQGTPPDCDRPAGAWQFPENYREARLCEVDPFDFRIEGDPTGESRNSLLIKISNPESEVHLTNLLTRKVAAGEGLVTVK